MYFFYLYAGLPPKIKTTAEAVLFFKEREVFETRALQTSPELHAIAPVAYHDGNRCKANLSAMCVSPSKSELYVDRECFLIYSSFVPTKSVSKLVSTAIGRDFSVFI